jgi:hypothetical protein
MYRSLLVPLDRSSFAEQAPTPILASVGPCVGVTNRSEDTMVDRGVRETIEQPLRPTEQTTP